MAFMIYMYFDSFLSIRKGECPFTCYLLLCSNNTDSIVNVCLFVKVPRERKKKQQTMMIPHSLFRRHTVQVQERKKKIDTIPQTWFFSEQ